MNNDERFIKKFNELDQLAQKLYPKILKGEGFNALRHFASTLSQSDGFTLLTLIKIRNTYAHNERSLLHFDQQSISFIQGLIDGANRKYYHGSNNKIDSDLENLRTKNLKKMGILINSLSSDMYSLNEYQAEDARKRLLVYIDRERKANGLDAVKKGYFEFMNSFSVLVKQEKKHRFQHSLEREKVNAINEIESMFRDIISETSIFSLGTRSNAKKILKSGKQSINRCVNFNQLEDCIEDIENAFDAL